MTRLEHLSRFDAYYQGRQYAHLKRSWDETIDETGVAVPFRQRRPSTIVPLPKLIVDTFVRALWATERRPVASLKGADGIEDNAALGELIDEAQVWKTIREATRRALTIGSSCVVWRAIDDRFSTEAWDAKHCTPTFRHGSKELERIEYRFPYTAEELNPRGQPVTVEYEHREVIDAANWTVFEPRRTDSRKAPRAETHQHNLGFVPAVWITIGERGQFAVDGSSILEPMLSIFDDLNFNASQQGRALYYNLDPQLVMSGVTTNDVGTLQKGGSTVWPVPQGADVKLLESSGKFVESARERMNYLEKQALNAAAVVLNDPEKAGGAQSGAALRMLMAPMIAQVDDLREDVGACAFAPLLAQMLSVRLSKPRAKLRVLLKWGSLVPTTPTDAKDAVDAAKAAVESEILSKRAAAAMIAPYVGTSDLEVEEKNRERDSLSRAKAVEAAALLDQLIPSATFQKAFKGDLAIRMLGSAADEETAAAIREELNAVVTPEDEFYKRAPVNSESGSRDDDESAEQGLETEN